ncbi:hypothetical protein [Streptomyces sp. NPDC057496]|uniref:hypothetical protein n=1 Tax=Streptomyces sp. NPDC057496 TaxID=3346149 RepID=UPI0036BFF100
MDTTPVRRTTMDPTAVRTAMVRHRARHRTTPTMPGTRARRCAAPDAPHRTSSRAASTP